MIVKVTVVTVCTSCQTVTWRMTTDSIDFSQIFCEGVYMISLEKYTRYA